MADNLNCFGRVYPGVKGFKVRDSNGNMVTLTSGGGSGLPEVETSDIGKTLLVNGSQYATNTVVSEQTITTVSDEEVVIPNWNDEYFIVGMHLVATMVAASDPTNTVSANGEVYRDGESLYCEFSDGDSLYFVVGQSFEDPDKLVIIAPFSMTITMSIETEPTPSSAEWGAGNPKYVICEPQELTVTVSADDDPKYVLNKDPLSPSYVNRPDPVQMLLVFDGVEYVIPWRNDYDSWVDASEIVGIRKNEDYEYWLYSDFLSMEGTHTIALYGLVNGGTISEKTKSVDKYTYFVNGTYDANTGTGTITESGLYVFVDGGFEPYSHSMSLNIFQYYIMNHGLDIVLNIGVFYGNTYMGRNKARMHEWFAMGDQEDPITFRAWNFEKGQNIYLKFSHNGTQPYPYYLGDSY